jgi:two-component system, OmpR family, alkaline phosphatase synthesis response regulator PhoP
MGAPVEERLAGGVSRRILIIEDNEKLAVGLTNNLRFEGYQTSVASDATTGIAAARADRPDLIILDLMLPDRDGYEVLRELRATGDLTPVLVVTALGEEADKVRGFRFGADDYVTKPFGLMELLARIDALLRRAQQARQPGLESVQAPGPVQLGSVVIHPASHTVTRDGELVALRPMEYDLLIALLNRRGQLVTRTELLREVWGYNGGVMSRTVDTHIAELRRKLEPDPANPRYILTVRKAGYRLAAA